MNSQEKKFVPAWWDLFGMVLTGDKRLLVIVPAIVLFCVWFR
jgi:hypothetical protein